VARSDRPVLVVGPTGSGKELVVQAIHALSERSEHTLLDLDCGSLPATLIESMLFGHERGAFTGADRRREGFFSVVGKGTLFLDEIAEVPIELQAKLLRVLETKMFRRVGSADLERFEGRIVAATHANLETRVAENRFREDLLYRLNVLEVQVPALEERRDDIPALIFHFSSTQACPMLFSDDAITFLQDARWPGNVRQLRNVIDRLAVFAPDGLLTVQRVVELASPKAPAADVDLIVKFARAILTFPEENKLAMMESVLIAEAMRTADGCKVAAARLLGVHRKVVERRLDGPGRKSRTVLG